MLERKLVFHIVSKEGVYIDLERVFAINKFEFPRNTKYVQSFISKINFLKRFILDFAEMIKKITDMILKDVEINWNVEAKTSFKQIKN